MEGLLDVTIWVHVGLGLTGFVLWPILFVARKGTPFHVAFGKAMVLLGTVVLVTAIAILFNPAYTERFEEDIVRYGWRTDVSKTLFVWIWGYYLYFLYSGWRIWLRWRAGTLSRGPIDYGLTAVALLLGGVGTVLGLVSAAEPPLDYPRLLPMSLAMLVFGLLDLRSYRRPATEFRSAYVAHGSRLYFGWWMLLVAPLLRSPDWGTALSFASTALVLVGYVGLRWWWLRQLSTAEAREERGPRHPAPE